MSMFVNTCDQLQIEIKHQIHKTIAASSFNVLVKIISNVVFVNVNCLVLHAYTIIWVSKTFYLLSHFHPYVLTYICRSKCFGALILFYLLWLVICIHILKIALFIVVHQCRMTREQYVVGKE